LFASIPNLAKSELRKKLFESGSGVHADHSWKLGVWRNQFQEVSSRQEEAKKDAHSVANNSAWR